MGVERASAEGGYGTGERKGLPFPGRFETGATGLEPATSGVTGRRSNQLNYAP